MCVCMNLKILFIDFFKNVEKNIINILMLKLQNYIIDVLLIEIEGMLMMNLKERLNYLFTNSNSIKYNVY